MLGKQTWSILVVVGLTAAAPADSMVFDGVSYDALITDPVPVGSVEDLLGVTLRIVNTTGDPGFDARAFDGAFFGYTGISGSLHQHCSTALATFTPTTDSAGYATAIDTHFLYDLADMLIVTDPCETIGASPSAEPSDAPAPLDDFADVAFGSNLTGVFAVVGDVSVSLDLAWLVVDAGSTVTLDFFICGSKGGEIIDTTFTVPVPEPITVSLLAVGSLSLLRRKR